MRPTTSTQRRGTDARFRRRPGAPRAGSRHRRVRRHRHRRRGAPGRASGRAAAARPPARGQARADLERRRPDVGSPLHGRDHDAAPADREAARPRDRSSQARRARGSRPGRQRVHVALHNVRELLDLRGLPAHLPDLRDARGRASRRARDRPGRRHEARTPDPDVPLRGPRLRPAGRGSRRCGRRRGGVRDGLHPGERARQRRGHDRARRSVAAASSSRTRSVCS